MTTSIALYGLASNDHVVIWITNDPGEVWNVENDRADARKFLARHIRLYIPYMPSLTEHPIYVMRPIAIDVGGPARRGRDKEGADDLHRQPPKGPLSGVVFS